MTYPTIAAIILTTLTLYLLIAWLVGRFCAFSDPPEIGDDEADYRPKRPEDIAREVGP